MRHRSILPAPQMRQVRSQLIECGVVPGFGIDACVARSWHRSLAVGLKPDGCGEPVDNLSHLELQRMRELNHDLVQHSQPVMEYLLDLVSNTQSMVILSDRQGVLMHTMGDIDFLTKAERVALTSGASWNEHYRGTNAIGTALAEAADVEIHGEEHFLERNGFLTCAAAPIMSATGQLLGVLDISGDQRSRHPHTLGLVSTAARMIENSLVQAAGRDQVLLMIHSQVQGIGSIAQGLLSFSEDGWLIGANRRGLELMGLSIGAIGAHQWDQLFACSWSRLLQRRAGAEPAFRLRGQGGRELWAQLQPTSGAARSQPIVVPRLDNDSVDRQWQAAFNKAGKVFDKNIPVLVTGETGVGKELLAKALHRQSARREKPFVAINCAAIPEQLIESELFGYAPGAFTGGNRQGAIGRLREAHGGTLFLDEIGDMPMTLQSRLLRVLQERVVTPLGSGQQHVVDFALICATHQNLAQAVLDGQFRSDLLYRINGLCVKLPALRERTDFATLTRRLLADLGAEESVTLAPELLEALPRYQWPGNLRQYANVLRTALALMEPDQSEIDWQHLPDDLVAAIRTGPEADPVTENAERHAYQSYHLHSEAALTRALEECQGNVSAAARKLGISRQTLYRRLKWK